MKSAAAMLLLFGAATFAGCGRGDVREWRPSDHEAASPEELAAQSAGGAEAPDPGAVLYSRLCASCHGVRGRGDGPQAAMLRVPDLTAGALRELSDDAIRTAVLRGKGRMPGFGDGLERQDLDAIVRHTRRLTGR